MEMERYNNSSHTLIKIHNKNYIASPKKIEKKFTATTISLKKDDDAHKSKFCSNKTTDVLLNKNLDSMPMNKEVKSNNNLNIMNKNYKKDLFEKFSEFLHKKKFKLSNDYDAKHCKKFLDKKDKCLERIIISDIIENENKKKKENISNSFTKKKVAPKLSKKYFIVISNYDDEIENNKNQKDNKSVNARHNHKD